MGTVTLNVSGTPATAPSSSTYLPFAIDALTVPSGATVTGIRAQVTCSASGPNTLGDFSLNSGSAFVVDFVCFFAPTSTGSNTTVTADGADHTYDLVVSTHSASGDALTTLLAGGAYFGAKLDGATAGSLTVTSATVFVDYTGGLEFPCDTDVALDLSTAVFLDNSGTLSGQYVDGVICTTTDHLYPDFYFPGLVLDAAKPYRVTVTYDPSSAHDSGRYEVYVAGVRSGHEQDDVDAAFTAGGEYSGGVAVWWDTDVTFDPVQTFVVGPGRGPGPISGSFSGLPTWDDGTLGVAAGYSSPWFETDVNGAVLGITIRKVCTSFAPPLRLTNRDDMFASARRLTGSSSRQASNRLTGYL